MKAQQSLNQEVMNVHTYLARLKNSSSRKRVKKADVIHLYLFDDTVHTIVLEFKGKHERKTERLHNFDKNRLDVWKHSDAKQSSKSYEIRINMMPLSFDIFI